MPFAQTIIPSAFEILSDSFSSFRKKLSTLIKQSHIRDRGFNRPGSPVVFIGAMYRWAPLDGEALVLQRELIEEWGTLKELVAFLIKGMPNSVSQNINKACKKIDLIVKQDKPLWSGNKSSYESGPTEAVADIVSGLQKFAGNSAGKITCIPDTNALLWEPDFREYVAPNATIELVLVPTVLSELDVAKIHKNEFVQQKAEKIIRQIKDFRRRGDIRNGVPVVKNKVYVRLMGKEPNMEESLGWFDSNNNDDRILASSLEIIRAELGTPIALVTRDINLQNKAELARVSFIEPPQNQQ